jgi:hypothetical protein
LTTEEIRWKTVEPRWMHKKRHWHGVGKREPACVGDLRTQLNKSNVATQGISKPQPLIGWFFSGSLSWDHASCSSLPHPRYDSQNHSLLGKSTRI